MSIKKLYIALAALALLIPDYANATLLTFDDVPGGSIQNQFGDMPSTYKGFNFSSTTLQWIDSVAWTFGSHSGRFALVNKTYQIGTITSGSDFTFDGLWARRWGNAGSPTGKLRGFNNGALVWSVDIVLNGSYNFFAAQAGAIDQLNLEVQSGRNFLIDDISLNSVASNTTSVPEPAPLALLGFGLLGLGLARKRRG